MSSRFSETLKETSPARAVGDVAFPIPNTRRLPSSTPITFAHIDGVAGWGELRGAVQSVIKEVWWSFGLEG